MENLKFKLETPNFPRGDQPKAIEALTLGIEKKLSHQILLGVTGSGKTFTMAHVIQKLQRPALILAPNKTLAAQLYGEMKELFKKNAIEYFVSYYDYYQPEAYVPTSDTYIEKDASINAHIEQMRLSATKSLLERRDTIIIATVSAIYGLGDPKIYLSMVLALRCGDLLGQRELLKRLSELHYTRNEMILERSHYRVRGDIIDIFPAESEAEAIRVELFDNRVESLRYFDPLTGEILRQVTRVTIFPKSHYVTPREHLLSILSQIQTELKHQLKHFQKNNKYVEAQRLEQRVKFDLEMMEELGYCNGIENYSRYLSGRQPNDPPPTLLSYLPSDALLFIDESHVTIPQLSAMYKGDRSRKTTLVEYGFRLPSALDNRPLQFAEIEKLMPQTIFVSATPGVYELSHTENIVEQVVRPTGLVDPDIEVRPIQSQIDDLLSEINRCIKYRERVLVTTLTKKMAEHLTQYLSDHGIKVRYLHSDIDTIERMEIIRDLRLGTFDVLVGINLLREGLDIPEVSLVAILDADKEGFLRSERSLIQTMGRAARHLNGKVIMYADKMTRSIQSAIAETERRRNIQKKYNLEHQITPQGIQKNIIDILEAHAPGRAKASQPVKNKTVAEPHSFKELNKKIHQLEKKMNQYIKAQAFEDAARIRDELKILKQYFKAFE